MGAFKMTLKEELKERSEEHALKVNEVFFNSFPELKDNKERKLKQSNTRKSIRDFIAGATSQDAISRKDEREKIITLFQDKLDLLDIYSFGKREWEIVRNIFKQVVEETTK